MVRDRRTACVLTTRPHDLALDPVNVPRADISHQVAMADLLDVGLRDRALRLPEVGDAAVLLKEPDPEEGPDPGGGEDEEAADGAGGAGRDPKRPDHHHRMARGGGRERLAQALALALALLLLQSTPK